MLHVVLVIGQDCGMIQACCAIYCICIAAVSQSYCGSANVHRASFYQW